MTSPLEPQTSCVGQEEDSVTKKNFFIFGHNIAHSLSPVLHNTGFRELGLPYHYAIHETEAVDATVEHILTQPSFHGASVTFPHKLQIGRLLDDTSTSAQKVGAVNTIVVQNEGSKRLLYGDNTDWVGIKRCIEKSTPGDLSASTVLVLGAGGAARAACYAAQILGVAQLFIVNRTIAKAEDMADNFDVRSRVFGTFDEAIKAATIPIRVIVACVPADDLDEEKIPSALFSGSATGILVEMAYRPQVTGMMEVAARHDGWKVCKGIDVLEEQAYEQFEMWTGRPAPMGAMRDAMRAKAKANM
jgi:shikimate-5-dehydrogenase